MIMKYVPAKTQTVQSKQYVTQVDLKPEIWYLKVSADDSHDDILM